MRFLIAALWLFAGSQAFAHDSWINRNRLKDPISKEFCCNHRDCQPVPQDGLQESNGGYHIVETGETWAYHRVIWASQDGLWYRCRYMSDQDAQRKRNLTRCLIGPPLGM